MKYLIYNIIFLLCFIGGQAQDIHFSQFYASPLTLNPALTGLSGGDCRLALNYRRQWASVINPYQTYSASYDMSILDEKIGNDIFGVGVAADYDQAGTGLLSKLNTKLSLAYHKSLGASNKHYLSAGFQVMGVQRSLNTDQLVFPNQLSVHQSPSQLSNQESFNNLSYWYLDMNTGLMWYYYINEATSLFAGASLFHITSPQESFFNKENSIDRRGLFHTGARFGISNKLSVVPNYLMMYQSKAWEIYPGASLEIALPDVKGALTVGGWYRWNDAVIAATSFEYKHYKLGLSYDITLSNLQSLSKVQGGPEISFIFTCPSQKEIKLKNPPCPKI